MVRISFFRSQPFLRKSAARASSSSGLRRRVGGADVVHRIDDAATHQVGPDAVDDHLREVRILGLVTHSASTSRGSCSGSRSSGWPSSGVGVITSPVIGCFTPAELSPPRRRRPTVPSP